MAQHRLVERQAGPVQSWRPLDERARFFYEGIEPRGEVVLTSAGSGL